MRVLTRKELVDDMLGHIRNHLIAYENLASGPLDDEQRYDPLAREKERYETVLRLAQKSDFDAIERLLGENSTRWECEVCYTHHDRVVLLEKADADDDNSIAVCSECLKKALAALENFS